MSKAGSHKDPSAIPTSSAPHPNPLPEGEGIIAPGSDLPRDLFHVRDADHGLMQHRDLGRVARIVTRHGDGLSQVARPVPAEHRGPVRILSARRNYFAHMLTPVLGAVPHEEGR